MNSNMFYLYDDQRHKIFYLYISLFNYYDYEQACTHPQKRSVVYDYEYICVNIVNIYCVEYILHCIIKEIKQLLR